MFFDGYRLGAVDALAKGWSGGTLPKGFNAAPELLSVTVSPRTGVRVGEAVVGQGEGTDDGCVRKWYWKVYKLEGSTHTLLTGTNSPVTRSSSDGRKIELRFTSQGVYRVYAVVHDGEAAALGNVLVQVNQPPLQNGPGLSGGAIAGIVIACVVVVGAAVAVAVYFLVLRKPGPEEAPAV
jgi:hypothetical protein